MIAGEFVYKYTGDSSGLKKAQSEVKKGNAEIRKDFKKSEKSVFNFGNAMKVGLVAAVAIGLSKVKQFFSGSVQAASDAFETAQKFGNVFPTISKKANNTAKELTKLANVSLSESKALLATSGNLLQSIGATEETALSYGKELGKMAADLKSFNNLTESTEMIQQRLTKALLGEREALIGVDIKLSEKDLSEYAATQGVVWKNATRLQKAEVTLNALRQKSKLATDDVTKSAGTYAHVTRALENRQKDLTEEVGKQFLPALTELKKAFLDSSNDGGFLYNALLLIGKAVGKVIEGLTVLIRTLDYVTKAYSEGKDRVELVRKEFDKAGASWVRFNLILLKNRGNTKKAFEEIKKGAESGDEGLKKMAIAFKNAKNNSGDLKNTAGKALDSLNVAVGKFTGSLKEGEKAGVKGFQNISTSARQAGVSTKKAKDEAKEFLDLPWQEKLMSIHDAFSNIATGIQSLLGAIDQFYQASADAANERLETQRQAALEAAGVAEETELQKAQRELDAAKEKGDKELIQEKQIEVKRAKINEDFDKRKGELEYNANLRSWELQLAMAKIQMLTAPLNAYVSSLSAPWPLNMVLAPLNSALALATATLQHAAIAQAKPQKPKFQEGGFVGGNITSGDRINARLNSGEAVLNPGQQRNFMDLANGGGMNQPIIIHNRIEIDGEPLYEGITEASRDGRVRIDGGSIIQT